MYFIYIIVLDFEKISIDIKILLNVAVKSSRTVSATVYLEEERKNGK
jgi:hypothetical protein